MVFKGLADRFATHQWATTDSLEIDNIRNNIWSFKQIEDVQWCLTILYNAPPPHKKKVFHDNQNGQLLVCWWDDTVRHVLNRHPKKVFIYGISTDQWRKHDSNLVPGIQGVVHVSGNWFILSPVNYRKDISFIFVNHLARSKNIAVTFAKIKCNLLVTNDIENVSIIYRN